MMANPKASENEAKTIAGKLPNRLPMRDSVLGAASRPCPAGRSCIWSPNQTHRPTIWPKRHCRKVHLTALTRRIVGKWRYRRTFTCRRRRVVQFSDRDRDRIEPRSLADSGCPVPVESTNFVSERATPELRTASFQIRCAAMLHCDDYSALLGFPLASV